MVKFVKISCLYIVHAFLTISGQKLMHNKIDIIWKLFLHGLQWHKSQFHTTFLDWNVAQTISILVGAF